MDQIAWECNGKSYSFCGSPFRGRASSTSFVASCEAYLRMSGVRQADASKTPKLPEANAGERNPGFPAEPRVREMPGRGRPVRIKKKPRVPAEPGVRNAASRQGGTFADDGDRLASFSSVSVQPNAETIWRIRKRRANRIVCLSQKTYHKKIRVGFNHAQMACERTCWRC